VLGSETLITSEFDRAVSPQFVEDNFRPNRVYVDDLPEGFRFHASCMG
jgi:hypothetical protein